mgnify:CR=1 FL=1
MNQAIIDAKKALVSEIADKMKNAESAVVVEYRGLTVAEMTELRRNLRAEDVEFKVYKNAMAQRAAESIGADGLKEVLVGPNAIAFGKDAVAPARVLAKFAKTHEALVLKSGIVEGNVVGVETIQKLSSLPNKRRLRILIFRNTDSVLRNCQSVWKQQLQKAKKVQLRQLNN